jgi:hypothetical protein
MSDVRADLILELLRAIRATQAEHTGTLGELRERVGLLEGQCASISRRLDRVTGDVEQIPRRLDLAEAPAPR